MLRTIIFSLLALVAAALVFHFWDPGGQRSAQDHRLLSELNAAEGDRYRGEQAGRPGVVSLGDGLLVEVQELGSGPRPALTDWVSLHYRGSHIDGRVFEDSFRLQDPATVPVAKTIAGWQRALPSMPVGSKVRLVVPPALAYGEAGGGPIGPGETLVFDIDLLDIVPPPQAPERTPDQMPVPGLR